MVRCIQRLRNSIRICWKELSAVFFKKDNLRSRSWWLSAFYAFSIQSMVRTGIQILVDFETDDSLPIGDRQNDAVKGYFSDALHLFIAASSSYDPLMKDYSTFASMPTSKTEEEKTSEEYFKVAQRAVKQDTWVTQGIGNSMQYLQTLFEDCGAS